MSSLSDLHHGLARLVGCVKCALAAIALMLCGCYADLRLGGSAPVGHGHGGAGADIGLGIGGDRVEENWRLGGGAHVVLGGRDDNGFVAIGAEMHGVFAFSGNYREQWRWLAVSHLAIALADPENGAEDRPDAARGAFADGFVGIGLGATRADPNWDVKALHVAVGVLTRRFFPDRGDAFWSVGGAIQVELTWGP